MRERGRGSGPKVTDIHQVYNVAGYRDLSPTGKGVFRFRCNELLKRDELYFTDLDELVLYADLWDFIWETREEWRSEGRKLSFIDRMGNKRLYANPSVKMWRDAIADLETIGAHFGFQPLSRKKLAVSADDSEDPVEALLKMVTNDRSRARKNS